ncbi:IgLON family member 5 [Liparis tanakae]|uniref:IgLON family member 5 n=1 Tax=Liparis tanakae TaxID=230148 RepID=A0A4Z2IQ98_9TELE|nr:IgLON family member 5 [Liparis tanakae]
MMPFELLNVLQGQNCSQTLVPALQKVSLASAARKGQTCSVPARITNISKDVTVNEGSNVNLMCLAVGRPEANRLKLLNLWPDRARLQSTMIWLEATAAWVCSVVLAPRSLKQSQAAQCGSLQLSASPRRPHREQKAMRKEREAFMRRTGEGQRKGRSSKCTKSVSETETERENNREQEQRGKGKISAPRSSQFVLSGVLSPAFCKQPSERLRQKNVIRSWMLLALPTYQRYREALLMGSRDTHVLLLEPYGDDRSSIEKCYTLSGCKRPDDSRSSPQVEEAV